MMQGYPLSANLPEDIGLGERFWYWRGASGQAYIHSIYARDLCPAVPGAVFVIVSRCGGSRLALAAGRFGPDGRLLLDQLSRRPAADDEIHVHLLAREEEAAVRVLQDLAAAMEPPSRVPPAVEPPQREGRGYIKPVQLELLAA